jgi:hypothetical protein
MKENSRLPVSGAYFKESMNAVSMPRGVAAAFLVSEIKIFESACGSHVGPHDASGEPGAHYHFGLGP